LEVAKFLQNTVGETALHGSSKSQDSSEFVDFFQKWRISGDQAPTEDILKIAKVNIIVQINQLEI
jgi:LETM1 and EF-hand domain-containing protein 1